LKIRVSVVRFRDWPPKDSSKKPGPKDRAFCLWGQVLAAVVGNLVFKTGEHVFVVFFRHEV